MKRKQYKFNKMTQAELRAAGHIEMADECLRRREISIRTRGRNHCAFTKKIPRSRRFMQTPTL